MNKVLYYFYNDFHGSILFSFNKMRQGIILLSSTLLAKFKMKVIGVKYGRNVTFTGNIQIERFPMSRIIIGNNCRFNSHTLFNQRWIKKTIIQTAKPYSIISIGNNCGFSGVSIVADKEVNIGNNVLVGANTIIGDRDDHPDILKTIPQSIYIEDNVFIGMHCIILKGVKIGKNSIIGAGSLVNCNIPSNCLAAGVPCKIIRINDERT